MVLKINNFAIVDDLTCIHVTGANIKNSMIEFQNFVDIIKKAIDSVLLEINIKKTG